MFKSLNYFIKESLILEGSFKGGDWIGVHIKDYHYPKQVIHDLLTGKSVKLEGDGEITLEDFDKAKLEALASKLERNPELTTYLDFNDTYVGDKIPKKKNIFLAIDKIPYSKGTSNSLGENAESLVCYLFNNGSTDETVEKFTQKSGIKFDDVYIKSCKAIVQLLHSHWKNSDYQAVHVDGKDYDSDINQYSKYISMIFKSKALGKKVLGFSIDDLYSGKKDKWNPADIILIKNDTVNDSWLKLQEVAKDGAAGVFGEPLNTVLSTLCNSEDVIPVSLKKCLGTPKLISHCVHDEDALEILDTNIKLASTYAKDKKNGSIYLISLTSNKDSCVIQFRTQDANNNNLSIESFLSSKSARGGKGLSVIKNALGLKNNSDYYAKVDSNEKFIKELKKYGFEIKATPKAVDKLNPPLYQRTAAIGLLGLIQKFKKFVESQGDTYNPERFAEFCWQACSSCPGAYYTVHD